MPGYTPTPEDLHLQEVYGDWVHINPGTHLDGGVGYNKMWRGWWQDLAVMPSMGLRRAKQEGWATLRGGTGRRAAQVAGQTVELRAVHRLSDGDPATSPTCHRIPSNPTKDREATERLEGRAPRDVGGGDPVYVRTIPNRRMQRGV